MAQTFPEFSPTPRFTWILLVNVRFHSYIALVTHIGENEAAWELLDFLLLPGLESILSFLQNSPLLWPVSVMQPAGALWGEGKGPKAPWPGLSLSQHKFFRILKFSPSQVDSEVQNCQIRLNKVWPYYRHGLSMGHVHIFWIFFLAEITALLMHLTLPERLWPLSPPSSCCLACLPLICPCLIQLLLDSIYGPGNHKFHFLPSKVASAVSRESWVSLLASSGSRSHALHPSSSLTSHKYVNMSFFHGPLEDFRRDGFLDR